MKKVSKKAYFDLVASVAMLFLEKKEDYLFKFDIGTASDRVNYVESVEALLISYFLVQRPTNADVDYVNTLRQQIKEEMC